MPGALGLVLLALSAGGIAGALLYGAFGAGRRRRPIMIAALVLSALGTVVMAILPPLGLMIAAAVAVGLFFGPVGPIMNVAMQTRAPPAFRGRVVGVMTATSFAAAPVGLLLAGPLVDAFGVQATFVALAVVFLAVGLVSAALPFLRELDGVSGGDAQLE
jgi:MFS family permease